jgi:hypothetical protein
LGIRERREEKHGTGHATVVGRLWEEEGSYSFSLLAFILHIK